ncbi:NACHT domain-containing protein [Planococcus sp. CP5-4]|uniref:NACHT domain-containing protein n=1 Tax=unclassified Planococcus (in: firmicutes) TaxID=2662419 RepID=UPI001C228434|nr:MULTISPECIES: NACHT domain-containing protein [unclassified Planococcus (in: firmicutes)]MBU9672658.1 NACHT domain-containing protein [Planococcus sp. CP5-4_YE]MBV0910720.1 NACHT domain-containing protein [Planococcus sp. CP5-4_UN]MBW6065479.1 NACHT domain-containing protein [Planococcus sp. CP5-4]
MKDEIKQAIPKLVCGEETATAFLISNDVAVTATHAIFDYIENKKPVKLFFYINNQVEEIDVEPIILDEEYKNQQIIALRLEKVVEGVKPIKCIDYKFNASLKCETYGYPPVRRDMGTFINLQVKNEEYAENYQILNLEWNIDLSKDDDIKDYKGVSGAPLILDRYAVAVLLKQVGEGGETSRLSAVSLYLYKEYFKNIGIDIIEKTNEPYYEPYLTMLNNQLNQQLQNTILRKLNKQSSNTTGLGFTFKFTNENRQEEKLESYFELLNMEKSAVILSEPGGGKTYLISMLAKDMIENPLIEKNKVPIILNARKWTRSYSNIVEGISKELKYTIPTINEKQVEQDLISGKYLILVDGLDEVTSSSDVLVDELIKISKIKNVHILVTCRKENYYKQFFGHFSEYVIDKLDDEMIREYIEKELNISGWKIFHDIDNNLRSLIKNPLFLFMTVSILKITGGTSLPKNKAELYASYIRYLIEERNYQKGLVQPFQIDVSTKEQILAEYAKRTFRELPTRVEFSDSVCIFLQRDNIELVKRELLDTGLIIEDNGELTFFHPSFHEYFFALNISLKSDEELVRFMKRYHNNDTYHEVFIYLAGLLKRDNRQSIFFDYLEKSNLHLYRKCLEARFNLNNQLKETWSKEYTISYFKQVRNSYLEIIESHFKSIKRYFYPWYLIKEEDIKVPLIVVIEGSMDFETPAIDFNFSLTPNEDKEVPEVILKEYAGGPKMYTKDSKGNDVSIPIMTFNGGNHWFLNLQATDMGIDSAREVALYSIKKQLKDIFDKKTLFDIEPPEMTVTQIEKTLKTLPLERFSMPGEKADRKPSLDKHSTDQLVDLFLKKDILQYANSINNSIYYSSEEVIRMMLSVLRFKETGINPKNYLLPAPDIDWTQLDKSQNHIWDVWSDEQLSKLIGQFYEQFQLSYRFLVENHIPSLKDFLPFYAMGPLKFNIKFYREEDYGGGVEITWEPVSDISKISSSIIQIPKRND